MKKSRLIMSVLACLLALCLMASSCDTATTTTASCAFVVGNGYDDNDANLHKVIYPGQKIEYRSDLEDISYVPCNSRNYIINDGTIRNANGDVVGDRPQLITASTSTGVPINIAATALWTLNQSEESMRDFYNVCFKYNCASTNDFTGENNYSTPGWNGMLAENFGPTMDAIARKAAHKVDDSIWKQQNNDMYKVLQDEMSALFADEIRASLGYPEDLFCGSGNSQWEDPNRPGEGTFTCSPVRIRVDKVTRGAVLAEESTEGALDINAQRLKNAKELYGENAEYWLGLQDTIVQCKGSDATCIFNIGGAESPTIQLPK